MRHTLLAALFTATTLLGASQGAIAAQPPTPGDAVRTLATNMNDFAFDLYAKLRAEKDGNLFFSPASISGALSMTAAGARGETLAQMQKVLHAGGSADDWHTANRALLAMLNARERTRQYQLAVANKLWGQQGYKFLPAFLTTIRDNYGGDLSQVDFMSQTEVARKEINDWVEKATSGKIKDLIPQGAVSVDTRLVLTNAIYFKGSWLHQFNKDSTQPAPFHLTGTQQVEVPLMYQKERYRFGRAKLDSGAGLKVLDLPYKGEELSMVLLLPDEVDGLAALEKELTAKNLAAWTAKLGKPEVMVWLPKFKATSEFQLNDVLSKLGMPLAFTPGSADFSGMDGKMDLYVSAAIHKAFVEVNEEGTEAAAATGIVVGVTSVPLDPPEFRADHPFAFLIRDNRSGAILFMGRVSDPR